jgi:CBS domain-containing protein
MRRDFPTIHGHRRVADAAAMMEEKSVGSLPVTAESGRLLGMITDRDIAIRSDSYGKDPLVVKVSDVMSEHVVSCYADDELSKAAETMAGHHIHRLPVLDRMEGSLVGMLSVNDIADHSEVAPFIKEIVHPLR